MHGFSKSSSVSNFECACGEGVEVHCVNKSSCFKGFGACGNKKNACKEICVGNRTGSVVYHVVIVAAHCEEFFVFAEFAPNGFKDFESGANGYFGVFAFSRGFGVAASCEGKHHDHSKNKCKDFFHFC